MRPRGDNHDHHDYHDFGAPDGYDARAEAELENELARRLRNLSWPKPPPGLKERCLREILARMEEQQEKKVEPLEATRLPDWREQRYSLTRSVAHVNAYRPRHFRCRPAPIT